MDSGSDSDGVIKKKKKRVISGSGSEASDNEERKQTGFIITKYVSLVNKNMKARIILYCKCTHIFSYLICLGVNPHFF